MKKKWIYQIRGLAIIAVVICHQQGILHDTEVIQLFTLFSVTTLVFLMGVTKALSIKKSAINQEGILRYTLRSVTPVLYSYIIATFVYSYRGGLDYNALLTKILDFSACGAFYFIEYFLILSLWAPLLYVVIKSFICKKIQIKYKLILGFIIFMLIWRVGYLSIDGWNIFGQSCYYSQPILITKRYSI